MEMEMEIAFTQYIAVAEHKRGHSERIYHSRNLQMPQKSYIPRARKKTKALDINIIIALTEHSNVPVINVHKIYIYKIEI